MMLDSIDISRCFIAAAVLSLISIFPALLTSLFLRENRRGGFCWVVGAWLFLSIVLFLWPAVGSYFHPHQSSSAGFLIGVSWISVVEIVQAMLGWLWVPTVVSIAVLLCGAHALHRRAPSLFVIVKAYVFLACTFTMMIFYFGGFHQEDTRTSSMFAFQRFRDIAEGMTLSQVQTMLGQPLRQGSRGQDTTVVYAESMRTGWNATITIDRNGNRVVGKKMWWAD